MDFDPLLAGSILGGFSRSEVRVSVAVACASSTGIDMLLDLAHARAAAGFRQMPVKEYLRQLPLDRVRQIPLSGVRMVDGKVQDAHETHVEDDYRLLSGAITQTMPDGVTLEYFKDDKEALREMLIQRRQGLDDSGGSE